MSQHNPLHEPSLREDPSFAAHFAAVDGEAGPDVATADRLWARIDATVVAGPGGGGGAGATKASGGMGWGLAALVGGSAILIGALVWTPAGSGSDDDDDNGDRVAMLAERAAVVAESELPATPPSAALPSAPAVAALPTLDQAAPTEDVEAQVATAAREAAERAAALAALDEAARNAAGEVAAASAADAAAAAVAAPRPAPPPPVNANARADQLRTEIALIGAARDEIDNGDPAAALRALRRHAQRHPDGQLIEEREALEVVAFARSGRLGHALALGERFLRKHARSVHARAVRDAIAKVAR